MTPWRFRCACAEPTRVCSLLDSSICRATFGARTTPGEVGSIQCATARRGWLGEAGTGVQELFLEWCLLESGIFRSIREGTLSRTPSNLRVGE